MRLQRLVQVYTCQNATMLEISFTGSNYLAQYFSDIIHALIQRRETEGSEPLGLFPAILRKARLARIGKKMIDLKSKLGEINDIEHNKGSKTFPPNQVILEVIMPSIPLKYKCLSIILIWVIVSHKY